LLSGRRAGCGIIARRRGPAGFSPGDGLLALLTLNAYVLGDVLDLQAEDGRPVPSEHDADPDPGRDPGRDPGQDGPPVPPGAASFPLLRAATGALSSPGDRFEHGLGILIDGLRARHTK
jgi:hypothetical protein